MNFYFKDEDSEVQSSKSLSSLNKVRHLSDFKGCALPLFSTTRKTLVSPKPWTIAAMGKPGPKLYHHLWKCFDTKSITIHIFFFLVIKILIMKLTGHFFL
jgi:hypothetical protein